MTWDILQRNFEGHGRILGNSLGAWRNSKDLYKMFEHLWSSLRLFQIPKSFRNLKELLGIKVPQWNIKEISILSNFSNKAKGDKKQVFLQITTNNLQVDITCRFFVFLIGKTKVYRWKSKILTKSFWKIFSPSDFLFS